MAETKKVIMDFTSIGGSEVQIYPSSGGQPGPDTVGTEQIIDGAVEEQDLHDDVKSRMTITHDASTGGLRLGGYAQSGEVPVDNSQDVGQGGGEDSDDDTGFDTGVDDGEGDI